MKRILITTIFLIAVLNAWGRESANTIMTESAQFEPARCADAALKSFLTKFWDAKTGRFRCRYPDNGEFTEYWTGAQALDAVLDGAQRQGVERYRELLGAFYDSHEQRGWQAKFFDDQCWMTLVLLRAYHLTSETRYLERARALLDDIITQAWDETPLGPLKAGVWWDRKHTQKATAANAGAALAAARFFETTSDTRYLDFARKAYHNWHEDMVCTQTRQVWDHVKDTGELVRWRFTYNEGLMIGAAVALKRATGEARYLTDAHQIARFMVTQETTPTAYGPVLYDGTCAECKGDCQQFKGIGYRYLELLWREGGRRAEYAEVLRASAQAIWYLAREEASTTFGVDWAASPASGARSLQENSSALMALNLFATGGAWNVGY